MKILIIGDWPKYHGGVVNYSRPLALELNKKGHDVFYLYTTANLAVSTFGKTRIKQELKDEFPFKSYCLWDGKALLTNYDQLNIDTDDWITNSFENFLNNIKPDIIHIHEILGFSSHLIKSCTKLNIPVINTIHEYWFLCPHRVMVDFNRKICDGPDNFAKCAFCVKKKSDSFNRKRILFRQRLNHYFHSITNRILNYRKSKSLETVNETSLNYGNELFQENENLELQAQIKLRLENNIKMLNISSLVIGVSTDVKNKLIKYGVNPNKILVQHIGSKIAETKIEHTKTVNTNEIVFGFIGGVGYYKGVHLIAQAFLKLNQEQKQKCKFEIFGKGNTAYIKSINALIKNEKDRDKFTFHGVFSPSDIPNITNQIDISILPSLCADTAPQTIFESYSASLPIIGPKIGGFPDFIENRVNGLLFEPANSDSLAKKIIEIIDNPDLLEKFKLNIPALKKINDNTDELISIYESLLE